MTDLKHAIGVDLGGTKIAVALVDSNGQMKKVIKRPTDVAGGPIAVKHQIVEAVNEVLKDTPPIPPAGLGIGVAGQIELGTGVVLFAPNLDWHDEPLQSDLQEALAIPVAIVNDVRAATWGEWLFGAGKGCDDLVCIFVGTGIGGGIVSRGRMISGSSNSAGEIGHTIISIKGRACTCGSSGCMESIAGGWALARQAQNEATKDPKAASMLLEKADNNIENITAKTVAAAFLEGDRLASRLMDEVTEALIAGAVSLVNILNPKRLILGGGIVEGLPHIVGLVERGIRAKALKSATGSLEVCLSRLGNDAGVVGAAAMVMMVR